MQELFYVIRYRQPDLDGSDHFMVFQPPENRVKTHLQIWLTAHAHITIDLGEKHKSFVSYDEAVKECKRLGAVASEANPDRIGAETVDPDQSPTNTLDIGKPA